MGLGLKPSRDPPITEREDKPRIPSYEQKFHSGLGLPKK